MSKEKLGFDVDREMKRLKKILNKDDSLTISSRFVKYLIEQTERVQELEKRLKIYQKRSWFEDYEKVAKQNKRYREALEYIAAGIPVHSPIDYENKARKALEGESE